MFGGKMNTFASVCQENKSICMENRQPIVNGTHHMMFALPVSVHQASTKHL